MSTVRFLGIIIFSVSLHAQYSAAPGIDESPVNPPYRRPDVHNFPPVTPSEIDGARGDLGGPDSDPSAAFPNLPQGASKQSISPVVSLRELQHPIPKKALRAAYEAERFANSNHVSKAIAKLEGAIKIDPDYRDAHSNLGVLYARAGRGMEARAQLQKALEIGPPIAPIYSNLALISAAMRMFSEAELYAHKALELDPKNKAAKTVLEQLPAH